MKLLRLIKLRAKNTVKLKNFFKNYNMNSNYTYKTLLSTCVQVINVS